ncbi:MAG: ferritin-like domain-containing protein [Armatimonadota bacterium]
MASVVNDLNELLVIERGEAEAFEIVLKELSVLDKDLADSGADVMQTASWSCSGLYRRITQLHGEPTLDASGLAEDVADKPDTKSKLQSLCKEEERIRKKIHSVLARDDMDDATRGFLKDVQDAHKESAAWCEASLGEWKPDK